MSTLRTLENKLRFDCNFVVYVGHLGEGGITALLENVHGGHRPTRTVVMRGEHDTVVGALLALQGKVRHHKTLLRGNMKSDLDALVFGGGSIQFSWPGISTNARYKGEFLSEFGKPSRVAFGENLLSVIETLTRLAHPGVPIEPPEYFIEGECHPTTVRGMAFSGRFAPIIDSQVTT